MHKWLGNKGASSKYETLSIAIYPLKWSSIFGKILELGSKWKAPIVSKTDRLVRRDVVVSVTGRPTGARSSNGSIGPSGVPTVSVHPPNKKKTKTVPTSAATKRQHIPSTSHVSVSTSQVGGEQHENEVRNVCEMGLQKDAGKKALQAAFKNPDRAMDHLPHGVPDFAFTADHKCHSDFFQSTCLAPSSPILSTKRDDCYTYH